ncbi:MAG TPA: hypothetical protein VHE34_29155 [Puia sp.]|uniref:hypothetical protein n=1 Tax=Puia sp. TaxID=2045100 RepID=UPI002CCB40CB|nr:hypothetical protein [Puia sp.]HVU99338.1 hypothetical protein [Puia sp.]
MKLYQYTLSLGERRRGFQLITGDVLRVATGIREIGKGMCQVFIPGRGSIYASIGTGAAAGIS